jgi:hypothetical protein
VYNHRVGLALCHVFLPGSTAPNDLPRIGALRQSRRAFDHFPRRLCCDDCRQLGVMGGRSNWSRIEQRRLMRRQREHVKGEPTFTTTLNKPPPRRLSKAELREQAEAALAAWRAGQTSKDK